MWPNPCGFVLGKFWGLIPTFVEVTGEKLVGGGLFSMWRKPITGELISKTPCIAIFMKKMLKILKL